MTKGTVSGDRKRRKSDEVVAPRVTEDSDRFMRLEEQLLPGIPNEITLEHITTRMKWSSLNILSFVSRAWRQAIQEHLVYDARVRSHSTETVVVIIHDQDRPNDTNRIALCSVRDKACYQLPSIREVDSGIPCKCQCISLDGKIYILGGTKEGTLQLGSQEVYVLDLAGRREWKQCASMQEGRQSFGCGVIDGKIYVFGGTSLHKPLHGSEVFDPNVNAWSAIKPMRSEVFDHNVTAVGDELHVYYGRFYVSNYTTSAYGFKAYHPVQDTWRVLAQNLGIDTFETIFMAQGKVHSMTMSAIYVWDIENNIRTLLHSFSLAEFVLVHPQPQKVVTVDDELLAMFLVMDHGGRVITCLVQSKGFRSEDKEILWEEAPYSVSFEGPYFMCPLQL